MKIDFTSLSDEDTYANLYGSAMNWLASDNNSGSGKNFKITYDVNAGTTYFFGARFYSGSSTGSFDVQLQEHEYPEIKVGETATATIENRGDIAYFKFVPEKDMKINFTSLSDNDTYGYLYDAEMTQLASDDNRGSGNNFMITYDVTAGTTYFFGAKFNSGSSTGSFNVQLQEYVYPEIKVGETATAAIENGGDIAYYKFVPEKDMWIVFTSLSDTDTTGYLYDAEMTQLASDYSSGLGSNFKITYEVTAGTTYYFGAKFESYSTGSFDVQLQELVCPEIRVGETATVTIDSGGDASYFKFVPEQDMRIVFTSLSDEDTTGCLYDADMNLLASDDNSGTGSNFKIIYNVTAGKTYYFNAKFKPGDLTGSFDVQLQEPVYPEIVVGETKTVTTTTDEKTALFKFDCKKDMLIEFSADMSWDEWENDRYTYGCLYDANMEKITSDIDKEFRFTYYVAAGQTYYLSASIGTVFDGFDAGTGTFDVTLKEVELWEHEGNVLTGYNGYDKNVTIPSELDGVAVTSLRDSLFYECTSLESVTIPDSVTSIGGYAFANCTNLESVTIPDSITSVGGSAFYGTPWESSLPDGLVYVGKAAYKMNGNCPAEVVIKDGTTSISGSAFEYCSSLTSVTIPDSVTSIGDYAFWDCKSLTSVTIPKSVTSIGNNAFGYCYDDDGNVCKTDGFTIYGYKDTAAETYAYENDFTFVTIYDTEGETGECKWSVDGTVLTISGNGKMGDYDWSGAPWSPDITKVIIEDGVTNVGEYAFYNCESLENVTIPDSVTSIGNEAFACCYGLTNLKISNSVTSIGERAFSNCESLESITIPDSVTSISEWAFNACTSLKSVTLGNSVTSIGQGAFQYCGSLTSVTIPDSVTSIGSWAFADCRSLKSVTIPASVTSIGNSAMGYAVGLTPQGSGYIAIDGFTIYGYPDTAAESYANDNDFTFIALSDKTDSDTGIAASVTEDVTLDVKDITGTDAVGDIQLDGETILKAYDITLKKGGEAVQPDHMVTVKIPCADETAKVYRVEADGSLTDMRAVYKDGYLVFTTDHLSIYIVAADAEKPERLLGDANGDGAVTILDATTIQRKLAELPVTGYLEKAADTNGDGEVTILDVTFIQKWIAELPSNENIGKPI